MKRYQLKKRKKGKKVIYGIIGVEKSSLLGSLAVLIIWLLYIYIKQINGRKPNKHLITYILSVYMEQTEKS